MLEVDTTQIEETESVGICRMTPKIFAKGQPCGRPLEVGMRRMSSIVLIIGLINSQPTIYNWAKIIDGCACWNIDIKLYP
jgi:hypothetical protein